ncbi:hypothetical protein BGP77_09645 [Saccharospirillum sp. MSK14-1]|uniref:DUF3185 family protein n=1 Tax=Saccharospirillum sp. MSK14-1 TaxID=1897632 RepID=UPI000D3568E6|nr:DUF3185 family protein [Saccharospirillum sp. MSK14-1]PTY39005.1 hypothetical protein BGP77_09645 [Saccharospirillum sp. MSK14-1]
MKKMIGLVLLVLGAGCLWWGYDMSHSVSGVVTDAVGGENTQVMIRYAAGAVLVVVGFFMVMRKA